MILRLRFCLLVLFVSFSFVQSLSIVCVEFIENVEIMEFDIVFRFVKFFAPQKILMIYSNQIDKKGFIAFTASMRYESISEPEVRGSTC